MQVRKILLKKYLPSANAHDITNTPSDCTRWVSLGHFDEIYTFGKVMSEGFDDILKSNNELLHKSNEENCYHPLYLIVPKATKEEANFWSSPCWHIVITRIHFSCTNSPIKQFETLKTKISRELGNTRLYQFYHTTELSDMVLVQKSNKLQDLLSSALNLRKYSQVGRTYTYVGINHEKIVDECYDNTSDKIPFFAIRFAVSDPNSTVDALSYVTKLLGDDVTYNITGVDDIVINFKDLYVKDIVALFKEWYSCEPQTIDQMLKAFSEITTRVGVHYECQKNNEEKQKDEVLQIECNRMLQDVANIQRLISYRCDRFGIPNEGWIKPILEISKTLIRMSQTAVLDEFVYLLFPGIRAFLKNVLELQKNNVYISDLPNINEKCNELVEECSHLLEQIMRVEGQLSIQPELRPVEYDIPVFLLEYILAFLNGVVHLLQKDDNTINAKIKFLIVPRLCEDISAMEIFRAEGSKKMPGLVLLNVPIKSLYTPENILLALCHETAHFAGEKSRLRDLRQTEFVHAAAIIFARQLYDSIDESLIERIGNDVANNINGTQIKCIDDLLQEICVYVQDLVFNEDFYYSFIWESVGQSLTDDIHVLSTSERYMEYGTILDLLDDIKTIFREIYADLCMLRILNLSPSDYVNALIDESYKNHPEGKEGAVLQTAIRIYTVLAARNQFDKCKNIEPKSRYLSVWKRCYRVMKSLHEEICINKSSSKWIIPSSCVNAILKYAQECNKSLAELDSELIMKLQEMYTNTKFGIEDYSQALRDIGESRQQVIASDD